MMYKGNVLLGLLACLCLSLQAQDLISEKPVPGAAIIATANGNAVIYSDDDDFPLVRRAAALFKDDIERVTGKTLTHTHDLPRATTKDLIIIGSIERSALIKHLIRQKKINVDKIKDSWEGYVIQHVVNPINGVNHALVIAGSDRRGAAYGVMELCKEMGVSPWYWWADVPVKKKKELYVKPGAHKTDAPAVKYRGIFINDEAPALSGWSKEKFGGFNHLFYEKVFELMLRLRANYLWPAMWGNAFYDDDPFNIDLANDYGIVIGTSHHEPLMRAHDEWRRYGTGKWNYDSNEVRLKEFWRGGMERATNEKIVSIGMRGDGDEPMTRETATALLERIVKDQREIITEVTGKPAEQTPQLWALYKEVQDYYDKGMRVPDDVTLLLCDDNWGNIRKLPKPGDPPRKGGYGIYYHFDYVGGPRNYKWLNTNPIARVWEQMHLAWQYNARQIWIVNVGDIKPMEFPISFFLDYAWNPEKIKAEDLQKYTEQWAAKQFGSKYAVEIADIISKYTKYNGRRKPELLDANTYQLFTYNESERVKYEYDQLELRAKIIYDALPAEYKDSYFQLVYHPVKACANLHNLYHVVALNRYYASIKHKEVNHAANVAKFLYENDSLITQQYHAMGNGKWNHMMSQTHIGYTYWQQPPIQRMPQVRYVPADSVVDHGTQVDTTSLSARHLVPKTAKGNIFYEQDAYVSIEADHYTRAINTNGITWKVLPDHGKTGSAITPFPVTASSQTPGAGSPQLEYEIYTYNNGPVKLNAYFSPTLNFHNNEGLQYAVSIDNEKPQIISINKDDNNTRTWGNWVANNIIIKTTNHTIDKPGKHVIRYWMVSPAVVLQKMVLDFGQLKPSYLGPPETRIK